MPILFWTTSSLVSCWAGGGGVVSLLFMAGCKKRTGQNPDGAPGLQPKNRTPASARVPKFAIIVPCRLESTRFPRKLLHEIKGRPLLLWVAERIAREAPQIPLWFAVNDELLRAPLA